MSLYSFFFFFFNYYSYFLEYAKKKKKEEKISHWQIIGEFLYNCFVTTILREKINEDTRQASS